jgi:serine protease AprX
MRNVTACGLVALLASTCAHAGPYVTQTSGVRWSDVGGIRWNDVGGIRWNDVGGIRWNDVGGIRWNDVGELSFTDASAIHWSDATGLRFTDADSVTFDGAGVTGEASIDLRLLDLMSLLPDSSEIDVVITYFDPPSPADLAALRTRGVLGGTLMRRLPMVVASATKQQIRQIASFPHVRSVFANVTVSLFDQDSANLVAAAEARTDPDVSGQATGNLTGQGVTIAVLDTGVDGNHPDLTYGTKLTRNVRLVGSIPGGVGFSPPATIENVVNTDLVLGHGTFVASVAAGTGQASGGLYAGIAPGASVVGLSAGDVFIVNFLEGFDYVLDHAASLGIKVVNCSWGTQGWFDPDDPVNVATRALYDAGISVVFAAGNHGPSPDTLNPYAVAPWVIGVGSTTKDGTTSTFSSRGIFEELLYHPTLVAPGEGIVAAKAGLVEHVGGTTGVLDPTGGTTIPPEFQNDYTVSSGTSFAAPHVSGTIALMLQARPNLTPQDIRTILQQTATPTILRDRSEVGAGRLDAWAAVAAGVHPQRIFGAHLATWLDQRAYSIDHQAPATTTHVLPAGQTLTIPLTFSPSDLTADLDLAWGNAGDIADIDITVHDPSGTEIARSTTINGAGLFGRMEGVHLDGRLPPSATLVVESKPGTTLTDETFYLHRQTARATRTAYPDVDALPADARAVIDRALIARVIDGRGTQFQATSNLTRTELARSLALIAGVPQRVPGTGSFVDVSPADGAFPVAETIAGSRSKRKLMTCNPANAFHPSDAATRLDFAVAAVKAANLESQAIARAGSNVGLVDDFLIPDALSGYAAIALERGLLDPVMTELGWGFAPADGTTRLAASKGLLQLRDILAGMAVAPSTGPIVEEQPTVHLETFRKRPRR